MLQPDPLLTPGRKQKSSFGEAFSESLFRQTQGVIQRHRWTSTDHSQCFNSFQSQLKQEFQSKYSQKKTSQNLNTKRIRLWAPSTNKILFEILTGIRGWPESACCPTGSTQSSFWKAWVTASSFSFLGSRACLWWEHFLSSLALQ